MNTTNMAMARISSTIAVTNQPPLRIIRQKRDGLGQRSPIESYKKAAPFLKPLKLSKIPSDFYQRR